MINRPCRPKAASLSWLVIFATVAFDAPPIFGEPLKQEFERERFSVDDCQAFIIKPSESAWVPGPTPWVWYAPTLGNGLPGREEAWMFRQLLEHGVAVTGVDVGESYGSPAGRRVFQSLYEELTTQRGFHRKPVLLARSRGGLMLYAWAAEHPTCVGGIAGIYPVCNLASYPGIEKAAPAFNMSPTQLQTELVQHNPTERLEGLAQAKVPILHLHGDADKVVPIEANTALLAARYRALDGPIHVELIRGQGHNMWRGWFESQRLTDFMINHARKGEHTRERASAIRQFTGRWALQLPNGQAGWLSIADVQGRLRGELWTVGSSKQLTDVQLEGTRLQFVRKLRVGAPKYVGGPATGEAVPCQYTATVDGDQMQLTMHRPVTKHETEAFEFVGLRMPPVPPKPVLEQIRFGEPIALFNGQDLKGWRLTDDDQVNGWRVVEGELVNRTDKTDFSPYSQFGNLRTEQEFTDFRLQLEFKVPPGGNSGVYLRGMYEVQVLDRDSKMQGIHGVGSVFDRIEATENAGKPGGEWNTYDITLVDRHVTVKLNGKTVINNQPLIGCTNGALQADETLPGPIYLQGDHTSVSYRNLVLQPVVRDADEN